MARKLRESEARWQTAAAEDVPTCPLCGRPIPRRARQSLHHLVPKLKGGTHGETVLLHQICHNEIHATLTEAELARDYASIEALRSHPRLARFIRWVAKKDPAFHSRSQKNPRRKRR
ncbi:MAG: HNH endonuclease signature motif containing protein [Pseudomonadota bacterium]